MATTVHHTTQTINPRGPQLYVPFNAAAALITDTNASASALEFPQINTDPLSWRTIVDLTAFNFAKLNIYIGTVAPDEDWYLGVQYSVDGGSTWAFLNGLTLLSGGPAIGSQLAADSGTALTTQAPVASPWTAMTAASKAENAWLRLLSTRGDGVIDPVFGNVGVQFAA
jgi:hypothetical protein